MWSIHFIIISCYKMARPHLKSCLCELRSSHILTHTRTHTPLRHNRLMNSAWWDVMRLEEQRISRLRAGSPAESVQTESESARRLNRSCQGVMFSLLSAMVQFLWSHNSLSALQITFGALCCVLFGPNVIFQAVTQFWVYLRPLDLGRRALSSASSFEMS